MARPASGRGRFAMRWATRHAPCEKPPSTISRSGSAGVGREPERVLDGLERPAQLRLVVGERVEVPAVVPGVLRGDREQVGDVVERQPGGHVEHELLVLITAVDEHRRAPRAVERSAGLDEG